MKIFTQTCILATWLFAAVTAPAGVGSPRVEAHTASTVPMSIFCTPDGTGRPFTEAFVFGGGYGDAIIMMQVFGGDDEPIFEFPAVDIWLGGSAGGLVVCQGGASPDHNTDTEGRTTWTSPLLAGGRIDPDEGEQVQIVANDDPSSVDLNHLRFNSADIDGDGRVNLTDVGIFNSDLGGSAYRSDFHWDGVVNLSDAGMMAAALGADCP